MIPRNEQSAKAFDFRRPCRLSVPVEKRIGKWQAAFCSLVPEKWAPLLPLSLQWSPSATETAAPMQAESAIPQAGFGVHLRNLPQPTLLTLPRNLAILLVNGVVGSQTDELPQDRKLTEVEISLLELLAQEMLNALNESWSIANENPCRLGAFDPLPRLVRAFAGQEDLVIVRFQVGNDTIGLHSCHWYWPESVAMALFPQEDDDDEQLLHAAQMKEVAQRIPMQVSVRLGSASLHVSELATLSCGDVIVLDQRVGDPLTGYVGEKPVYVGWAGRVGNRQGFQVAEVNP
ncbi:MAG: FliM/FliN family flagellar motor switch protein [Pirellulaceae bacterium]|nr:FliM/FliN family flagellar motor switch protein [Planctomycetales bacterium]